MKHIHFPTLLLHGLLLVLAKLLMNDIPDGFLWAAGMLLVGHLIWSCVSTRSLAVSHLLGCGIQALVFRFGLIEADNGAFGLGGGGFALFFYLIALGGSAVLEAVIGIVRYYTTREKKKSP